MLERQHAFSSEPSPLPPPSGRRAGSSGAYRFASDYLGPTMVHLALRISHAKGRGRPADSSEVGVGTSKFVMTCHVGNLSCRMSGDRPTCSQWVCSGRCGFAGGGSGRSRSCAWQSGPASSADTCLERGWCPYGDDSFRQLFLARDRCVLQRLTCPTAGSFSDSGIETCGRGGLGSPALLSQCVVGLSIGAVMVFRGLGAAQLFHSHFGTGPESSRPFSGATLQAERAPPFRSEDALRSGRA